MALPKLMKQDAIDEYFDILAANIEPKSELNYETSLDLTIAVLMSAQCTDKAVNKVTDKLFKRCRTAQDYIDMGEAELMKAINSIGLFRNKAKAIIGLSTMLLEEFDGEVPSTREELQRLPGVGRKTANVILNVAFGQPTLAVDTHIFRVANRNGLIRAKTPQKTELALLKKIPERHLRHAHHYLILHGRYTCKARKPDCANCLVAHLCTFPDKTHS